MQYNIIKKKVLQFLGDMLVGPFVNVLCKTLKIEEENKSSINSLLENNQNMVFAFWHGTMLVPWYVLRKHSPSAIISKSKDGDLLVKVLKKWGYEVKRGSSSKDGKEVLEELIKEAMIKKSITITPAGPRGPQKIMKAGCVVVAKKAQIPLVLIGVAIRRKKKISSWDKFEIPLLFSRVCLVYSEPIFIDKNLTYEETDSKINYLSDKLNKLQCRAAQNC